MCGIAGLIGPSTDGVEKISAQLSPMLESLKFRGPDGEGRSQVAAPGWVGALGHRRLSIIDLEGGRQPLKIDNEKFQVTYNGEIFNFLDLKKALEADGEIFDTRSDTEVILRLFKRKSVRSFADLNGMFAMGIWDNVDKTLWLARDRVGIKPLYYSHRPDGSLIFSSDLMTLIKSGRVPLELAEGGTENYFFSDYFHSPHTILKDVFKVPPGTCLRWQDGKLSQPTPFWQAESILQRNEISREKAYHNFEARFSDAVSRQLISDVPVGILLSGGLDSTAVTAMASRKSKQLQTFSVEFDDPEFDEGHLAKKVADQFGLRSHFLKLDENKLLENLDRALSSLDEPMADPSILPTYLLCEMAAQHVKVVLGGDGGDELFAGYPTYQAQPIAQLYANFPPFLHRHLVRPAVYALPSSQGRSRIDWKIKRFFGRFDYDPTLRHLRWMSGTDLLFIEKLFGHEIKPWSLAELANVRTKSLLQKSLWTDFRTYLPSEVLVKVDRASMAHGLEVRPPFLDNQMIEEAFGLPDHLKISKGRSKVLIREYVEKNVGSWISDAPKKGFGIPINRWFKTVLKARMEKIVNDSPVYEKSGMSIGAMKIFWSEHLAGKQDHSRTLWAFLVLDHWIKRVY